MTEHQRTTALNRDSKFAALEAAIAEAERFIARAEAARELFSASQSIGYPTAGIDSAVYVRHDSPTFAAAKRASMDATRALARLRSA